MKAAASILRRVRSQGGQVVVLTAVSLVVLIGCAAIVFDVGRVYVAQQQLDAAVNSAALAAGQNLPNAAGAYSAAVSYGGAPGEKNAFGDSNDTVAAPNVTFECASHAPNYTSGTCPTDTSSNNCHPAGAQAPTPSGATTCNAIKITETATVKNTFGSLFFPSFTLSATTTAAARGGNVHPLHVEVILDTTGSMTSACSGAVTGISSPERIDCAKAGVRALLQALWPCQSSLASCGTATPNSGGQLGANFVTPPAAPVDEVGLMMFPAITGNPPTAAFLNKEADCTNSSLPTTITPTYTAYTYNSGSADGGIPASDDYLGYQAVGLSSDYRPSVANTTLNWTTSKLVESVDWGQCPGSTHPGGDYYGLKDIGGQGSYVAGAITEAQHLLNQNAKVGVTNSIIILSDGQLTSKGFDNTPCTTAINAAAQAKAAGTVVYSIGYGADSTACGGSGGQPNALATMTAIATSGQTFFNAPATSALTAAFQQVAVDLTDARLIPECTAAPPAC